MSAVKKVLVTGASGFVGGHIVRGLVERGVHVVGYVRNSARFQAKTRGLNPELLSVCHGDLFDVALRSAGVGCDACVHLVGIILEHARRGQTFERVHVEGTRRVLEAVQAVGIRRFVHMSALGARPDAPSRSHQTKFAAEEAVRQSGLDFTIFRPSVIHGPDGEFVRELLWPLVRGAIPPFLPCFSRGLTRLQPIYVEDLAPAFVDALFRPETIRQTYALGGPEVLTWRELWEVCRQTLPGARRWKPTVGIPVWCAQALGRFGDWLDRRVGWRAGIPFNLAQVQMSQEDNVCDVAEVERLFGLRLRPFRATLAAYADQIG